MILTDEEEAMIRGELGETKRWAMQHMHGVGEFFNAGDFIPISQAHMMADPESLGDAGVMFLENLAAEGAHVSVPMITDPRGVDLDYYKPLGQSEEMANLDKRIIAACTKMGILMTDTCINYQTIMAPLINESVAFGDTGVVIYSNSVCGARSNFEGGPSALAAGLTGRTPRYGLHCQKNRVATRRFRIRNQPKDLTDWGILGAVIGKNLGSYWEVPVIEGIEVQPSSDQMKHFGSAMASYGSTALFHLIDITPEALKISDVCGHKLLVEEVEESELNAMRASFQGNGDELDVVVFSAPQLSLVEMQNISMLCDGMQIRVPMIICTSPQVYADASRLNIIEKIESCGAKVLKGTCFYNQYAREIREANGWKRLMTNSAKLVNIIGGYGYDPILASMEVCFYSAVAGKVKLKIASKKI